MEISYDNFIKHVTERALHTAGVHAIPRAHKITTQQYCRKLSLRSACTGECHQCILKIKDMVDWITTRPDRPKEPYGLYTSMMKNAFARRVEEVAKRPPAQPEKDILGEMTGRDAFDIFLETL